MKIVEGQGFLDIFNNALLKGEDVATYTKTVKELVGTFKDSEAALEKADEVAYNVRSIQLEKGTKESLIFGVTYLQPLTINEECTLTRGHFHQDLEYGEVYIGLTGHAYLIKWDGKDEVIIEDVLPGSVHLIDGKYAHRLVNVADEETAVGTVWSPQAGHNYEAIEKTGFPVRVYKRHGEIVVEENK